MAENTQYPKAVLITGASTGIGEACALELDQHGFQVFAGVRTDAAVERLRGKASSLLTPVTIDVTDAASIAAALKIVESQIGQEGLSGLVNNAGVCVAGPLEMLPLENLRRQFEVNVIGQIAITQAFLPLLRKAQGRIVNIGSVNGAFAPPYLGPYAASKFAMEALTDSLRMELRKSGIKVSLVEPGPIDTPIWQKSTNAAEVLASTMPAETMKFYDADISALREAISKVAASASPLSSVVQAVVHALTAPKPKTRYFLKHGNRFMFRGFKVVPDSIRDWFICLAMGLQ